MVSCAGGEAEVYVARSPGAASREPVAFVLEFTGNATRAEQIAQYAADRWEQRPIELWAMNYPGYGRSTGPARMRSIGPAALAVFDELRRSAGDRPIILAGNSLGTAPAIYVAGQRDATGLILQNPPALRQIILGDHGWWNLWLLAGPAALSVPDSLDSIANARSATEPAVFLLADADGYVKPHYQKLIVDAYAGEKRIITMHGAGHNDGVGPQATDKLHEAMDWLLSQPAPADATPSATGRSR
jgi:hypothetical protein